MGNKNYLSGVRFERATIKKYKDLGWSACRSAGSHSPADVIAWRPDEPVQLLQCKVVAKPNHVDALIRKFAASTAKSVYYSQTLVVKVKGSTEVHSYTV